MSPYFDQRGQRVEHQANIVGNVGELNMGAVSDRVELVGKLERLKGLLAETASDQSIDEETVTDVDYQLSKAIGAAKKPEPEKSTILGHLGQAKALLQTAGAAAGVITALAQAVEGVQRLF